jgi:hypothetical protein
MYIKYISVTSPLHTLQLMNKSTEAHYVQSDKWVTTNTRDDFRLKLHSFGSNNEDKNR